MDKRYLKLFLERTGFPEEARSALLDSADRLTEAGQEEALDGAVEFFRENDFAVELTEPLAGSVAAEAGLSPYTVWMLLLIQASRPVYEAWGDGPLFWDTFSDLRYKALECKEIYGVWGTFVAFWYPIFYTDSIVKLGRLEFENIRYEWDQPFSLGGVTVRKGDPVKNIHIPSSGEPFGLEARLDSYRRAYERFRGELHGGPLVCVCHSWLLYPSYGEILAPGSNIADFQRDFALIGQDDEEKFGDAWRLFGAGYEKPLSELPERTSMQRAFKKYLLDGGRTGEGRGVLLFDGERLLTRRER